MWRRGKGIFISFRFNCRLGSNYSHLLITGGKDGATNWDDEQMHRLFDTVSKLVVPGDPMHSRLLLQPLALEAGGNPYHSGGRQFSGKNDPNWKILEQWVKGAKLAAK